MRHPSLVPLLLAAALCIAAIILLWLRPTNVAEVHGGTTPTSTSARPGPEGK